MRQSNSHELTRMAKTIHFTSKLLLLHANDLLDLRIIENDGFAPVFMKDDICEAIFEIVSMVRWTIGTKNLKIKCQVKQLRLQPNISFDKRRLQQVLLNLLSNAVKF